MLLSTLKFFQISIFKGNAIFLFLNENYTQKMSFYPLVLSHPTVQTKLKKKTFESIKICNCKTSKSWKHKLFLPSQDSRNRKSIKWTLSSSCLIKLQRNITHHCKHCICHILTSNKSMYMTITIHDKIQYIHIL